MTAESFLFPQYPFLRFHLLLIKTQHDLDNSVTLVGQSNFDSESNRKFVAYILLLLDSAVLCARKMLSSTIYPSMNYIVIRLQILQIQRCIVFSPALFLSKTTQCILTSADFLLCQKTQSFFYGTLFFLSLGFHQRRLDSYVAEYLQLSSDTYFPQKLSTRSVLGTTYSNFDVFWKALMTFFIWSCFCGTVLFTMTELIQLLLKNAYYALYARAPYFEIFFKLFWILLFIHAKSVQKLYSITTPMQEVRLHNHAQQHNWTPLEINLCNFKTFGSCNCRPLSTFSSGHFTLVLKSTCRQYIYSF